MSSTIGANSGKICIVLKRKTLVDGNYGDVLQKNNASSNERAGKRRRQMDEKGEKFNEKCELQPIPMKEKNGRRESAHQAEISTSASIPIQNDATIIPSTLDCNPADNKSTKTTTNQCSPSTQSSFPSTQKISFAFHGHQNPNRTLPIHSSSSSSSSSCSANSSPLHCNRSESSQSSPSISSSEFSSASSGKRVHYRRRTRQRRHSSPSESSSSPNGDRQSNNSLQSSYNSSIESGKEEEIIEKSNNSEDDKETEEDNGGLPAAFARARNGDGQSGEENGDAAEMSDHEVQMMRRRQQLRNKERWQLLKYRLLTASGMNRNGHGDEEKEEEESIEWNEELEREFVFSLL